MAISFTVTQTHRRGGETPLSRAMSVSAASVQDIDINMLSGSANGAAAGTFGSDNAYPNRSGLILLHYQTSYGGGTIQHHASGSYLSGGIIQQMQIASGESIQWVQTSGIPNPLFNSGIITALSFVKPAAQSGLSNVLYTRHAYNF